MSDPLFPFHASRPVAELRTAMVIAEQQHRHEWRALGRYARPGEASLLVCARCWNFAALPLLSNGWCVGGAA